MAARCFHPGQFYRLQNFETLAKRSEATTLSMEGIALTGAWVDRDARFVNLPMARTGRGWVSATSTILGVLV